LVASIDSTLSDKQQLLASLAMQLQFPDYFGGNWDALDECLGDLSWLKQPRVLIYHRVLPMPGGALAAERKIYLHTLASAVHNRADSGAPQLSVTFAAACKVAVQRLMR
jgi:hypothetical protein